MWGTLVTDCCNSWGIVTLSSYGPTFLKVRRSPLLQPPLLKLR